jgi:hypothetical protein
MIVSIKCITKQPVYPGPPKLAGWQADGMYNNQIDIGISRPFITIGRWLLPCIGEQARFGIDMHGFSV